MTAFRPRLRALLVGAAALALVTVGAGGTLAASTTPTVYACFNANGQVAMASIAQCKLAGGGQLVAINTQGIPGPTGPTGAQGPSGPAGPTGAPYAPTLVEWDFTVLPCDTTNCPSSSTTVFPAGTVLTPVSGEIDSVTGPGVPTCASSILHVDAQDSAHPLFQQQFNPAGALPKAVDPVAPRTLAVAASLEAFLTLCGTLPNQTPGASGKVILSVKYPPVLIP
jgi:hypothetical protein